MPLSGVLKRWNDEKKFGFIQPDDDGEDLFVHVSALLDGDGSVQEGDPVSFREQYDDRKGKYRAVDVEVAGGRGGGGRGRDRSRSRGGGGGRSYGGDKGGSKGSKPGDWECPNCGFNVFASKSECFKCGEPKPRGGGGGGGGRYDRDRDRERDYDDRRRGRDDRDRGYDDRRGGRGDSRDRGRGRDRY
mmetsp:Transcript_45263/g.80299  ORF Transcript_45263/g.80299 Transcript_45263/m.80299 type:complete len:188 (-) Transcript_45263:82-645(-)